MIDEKKLIEEIRNIGVYGSGYSDHEREENVIDIIEAQPKTDEWIPCSKMLPKKEHELYWTTHEDGSVILHSYSKEHGFIYNWEVDDLDKRARQGKVIAWILIPTPQPYKGVK